MQVYYSVPTPETAQANPMAQNFSGGTTGFITGGPTLYEVHTFTADGYLTFSRKPATVEVLVGGGGGSSGWSRAAYVSGGGNAGGYVYHPTFDLGPNYEIPVTVGAGGTNNGSTTPGAGGGGDSRFGSYNNYIVAYSGGGGATSYEEGHLGAGSGGSGGGGLGGTASGWAKGGTVYSHPHPAVAVRLFAEVRADIVDRPPTLHTAAAAQAAQAA